MRRILLLSLATCFSAWSTATSQTLELRTARPRPAPITVGIGDTVQIDVWAQLDCLAVSGIDVHLSLPADAFEVVDNGSSGQIGVQPFRAGQLFSRAVVAHNAISDLPGVVEDGRVHLRYAAVTPPGPSRGVKGHGSVASFAVIALRQVDHVQVRIEDTPILETRLVLPDRTTERRFASVEGIELSAEGVPTVTDESTWALIKRNGFR